jgi:hypothetical protein
MRKLFFINNVFENKFIRNDEITNSCLFYFQLILYLQLVTILQRFKNTVRNGFVPNAELELDLHLKIYDKRV